MVFQDIAETRITYKDFTSLAIGESIKSSERPITGFKDLRWAFHLVRHDESMCRVDLWLSPTDTVFRAKGTVEIRSYRERHTRAFDLKVDPTRGAILMHSFICQVFHCSPKVNAVLNVTFSDFDDRKKLLSQCNSFDFLIHSMDFPTDARITVGNNSLNVHRHVLCMISPVFHAAFAYDTKEAKTSTIDIKEVDFATVKNVIDACYGREYNAKTFDDFMDMLKFADMYEIKPLIEKLEVFLADELKVDSFCVFADYAWNLDKTDLKLKLAEFFSENSSEIVNRLDFVNLDQNISTDIDRLVADFSKKLLPIKLGTIH
uniref:BTB domain-containing protein n=1 Tax=Panagrellus redivivus TaxID=6233 RepID=A0A7E4VZ37_PANRE